MADQSTEEVAYHVTDMENNRTRVNFVRRRYPYCVVWTPIPCLTWLFPFIGHMGIAMSSGVIRDFAGPYYVSEDDMAFGSPTKYWQLNPSKVYNIQTGWDNAVSIASDEYKKRMHNLCCDNCHSHVAMALNLMEYNQSSNWNMIKLCFFMLVYGKHTGLRGFVRTWLPFLLLLSGILLLVFLLHKTQ